MAFRFLLSRDFVLDKQKGIVTSHLLSRLLTLPSLSSLKAHHSLLSSVFRFVLLELGVRRVLRLLFRFCAIGCLCGPRVPPVRVLDFMLRFLSVASLAAALGFGELLILEEDSCVE